MLQEWEDIKQFTKDFDKIWSSFKELSEKSKMPLAAWTPTQEEIESTNLYKSWKEKGMNSYQEFHAWSCSSKNDFWAHTFKKLNIIFDEVPSDVLDLTNGAENPIWCKNGKINIAKSCFNAPKDKKAIIYQKESGALESITYGELDLKSNQVANGLEDLGLQKDDAVAIDMAMTAESVIVYLGIVKAGMRAVSIADSFAPNEIKTRLRISEAKAIFTQDYLLRASKKLPLYTKVKEAMDIQAIVIPASEKLDIELSVGDIEYTKFLSPNTSYETVICYPDDITNILFSSGTTGDPKAIGWSHLTPIKSAMDGYFHHDIQNHDVVAWPTNLGWMMGPWLIYASLINQATMALYYGAPMGEDFGRFIEKTKVSVFGLVPSIVKNWRETRCMEEMDWSSIKCFSSTGECSGPEDYLYLMSLAHFRPVLEYCGGTEIGGGYITGSLVQPQVPSAFSTSTLGLNFYLLDDNHKETKEGEIFLIPPSIGLSQKLLNRDHHEVYFENVPKGPKGEVLRRHGDQMENLGNGYFRGQGRADDTMNLGGIKTSSAEIERSLNEIDCVIETAAIATTPKGGGPDQLVVYAVLNSKKEVSELLSEMQTIIKKELNPLFKVSDVVIVDFLPRTASNKVMRRVLRDSYKSS